MTDSEPHAYMHVPPQKTGETFVRLKVPVSTLKKFDYSVYLENPAQFKDKLVSFKDEEKQKKKGIILFTAASLEDLETRIDNSKRIRIPKINESINVSEDSSVESCAVDSVLRVDKENVIKKAKYDQKELKKTKKGNKRSACDDIINTYINENDNDDEINGSDYSEVSSNISSNNDQRILYSTSTPQRVRSRYADDQYELINAYKLQISFFKEKASFYEAEAAQWKSKFNDLQSEFEVARTTNMNNQMSCTFCTEQKQDADTFGYLDQVYGYSTTSVIQKESIDGKILLCNEVHCNSNSYRDSLKAKEPIEVIKLLSIGVYGYEDLATRCVRQQKNTQKQILLDPKRTEAIEKVFYRYLRLNRYPAHLLKKELNKCGIYHHNAIAYARSRIKKQKVVDEAIENLQQQINENSTTGAEGVSTDA